MSGFELPQPPGARSAASMGRLPDTLTQTLLLSRYQFRDYLRSRRFVLMMAIVAFIGAILSYVLYYYNGAGLNSDSNGFYGTLWAGGVTVVIVFSGIIFGGDAIAGEFQNKTGYFLMGLPVRRASVYAGKFIAAFAASLIAVLAYLVILLANGARYLGAANAFPGALGESFLISILYLLALLGAVFLFSSLFKNSLYAVLVVAVLFLFGFTLIDTLLEGLVKVEPWFIVTYASGVISYPFGVPAHVVRGFAGSTFNPIYWQGIVVMLGWFFFTALGGLGLFEREEFT
jgi:ABC-2 type transport system permease protein